MLLGGVALILYAASQPAPGAVFAGGVFIAAALALVGGFGGFLFGLPRSGAPTPPAVAPTPPAGAPASVASPAAPTANANIIEISDWLTKIIVGVGLTQPGFIPGEFQRLVDYLRGALGNPPGSELIVGALIVLYAVAGFLVTYLFTRTNLPWTSLLQTLRPAASST